MLRRTKPAAVLTLAMINVFTLAAGITVARMLPPRLAALKVPTVAAAAVHGPGAVLSPAARSGSLPTASGLRSALAGPLSAAALGPQVSAVVADAATGRVLLAQDGTRMHDPRLDRQARHLGGRARRARPGRHVHHPGGERHHPGQRRPGRRRRPGAGRQALPGPGLPSAGHAGQPRGGHGAES